MPDDQATTTIRLRVDGMGCDGCVASVRDALQAVQGVTRAEVDLRRGMAEVEAARGDRACGPDRRGRRRRLRSRRRLSR